MGFTKPSFQSRTVFVGREVERSQLQRLLESAIRGQGSTVLIAGEAGVGKTRLTEELALEARRQRVSTLIGRCSSTEGAIPYLPFVEVFEEMLAQAPSREAFREITGEDSAEVTKIAPALRKVLKDVPPPLKLPPAQERRYLFNAIRDVMARAARACPLLIVIDDLQWADSATLLLLENLTRGLADAAVLIVAAYRDSEIETGSPLTHLIEECVRSRTAQVMTLHRFSTEEVRSMLRAIAGQEPPDAVVDMMRVETDGNPYFLEELFKHLTERGRLLDPKGKFRASLGIEEFDVPDSVRLTLSRRLGGLSPATLSTLAAAAVLGRGFTVAILESLCSDGRCSVVAAIEEAQRGGLIVPSIAANADVQFTHELVRQTLLSELSAPRRQELHRRAAKVIARAFPESDQHASEICNHYARAGSLADPQAALPYLIKAGDRAHEVLAFEEALDYFARAVAIMPEQDPNRGGILFKLGLAQRSLGRWEEALASCEKAIAAFERIGETAAAGHVCAVVSHDLAWTGRFADALHLAQRGLALVGSTNSADRCRLLAISGGVLSVSGNHGPGQTMIGQALEIAEALNDEQLLGQALFLKGVHHFSWMRPLEALKALTSAAAHLRRASDLWRLTDALSELAVSNSVLGRFGEARREFDEARQVSERIGNLEPILYDRRFLDFADFAISGDLNAFFESARDGLEQSRKIEGQMTVAYWMTQLGLAEFWRGQWDQARIHFREGASLSPRGGAAGGNWACAALLDVYDGHDEQAVAMIRRGGEFPKLSAENDNNSWMTVLAGAEVLAVAGKREEAARCYPLVLHAVKTGRVTRLYDYRLLETAAGIAAAAGENWDAAEGHYENALKLGEELPCRSEGAEARRFYAQMLLDRAAAGDRDKACELLREAIETYTQIGMPKHREMAEALMKSAIARPSSLTAIPTGAAEFHRDGEYWTVAYGGKSIRVRDAKGLGYLSHLLVNPAKEIHVADLVAMVSGPVTSSGAERPADATDCSTTSIRHSDSGEILDREAARQYRTRLSELRQELEEASVRGDTASAEKLQSEIDFIADQLASAHGLGGRSRKIGDVDERLRKAVRNRITAAISRIREEHPLLGEHLAKSIRLGVFCLYLPSKAVQWRA